MKGNIPDKAYKVEKIYSLNVALAKWSKHTLFIDLYIIGLSILQ